MKHTYLTFILSLFSLHVVADSGSDALLRTLQHELDREYTELQRESIKPYFMSFRVDDFSRTTVQSNMGSTVVAQTQRGRTLTPQIRMGNAMLDNFKLITQGANTQGDNVASWALPLDDNDSLAICAGIWSEVRRRYEFAANVYRETQARVLTNVANEDTSACFSPSPVEHYYEASLPSSLTDINIAEWQKRLDSVSAVMRKYSSLQNGTATLNFDVTREYFVSTEGTYVVQNRVAARVLLTALAIADDGMELPVSQDFFTTDLASLPSIEEMTAVAEQLAERVSALAKAPVANPYTGPAILSGPASGVFFHEIFGHRLEAHRLKEGGETFRNMVGKQVLPTDFNVYCDPTLTAYGNKSLNGHYIYDSEGVKSRRVNNIKNGVLNEFLLSRVPMDGFPKSNGHGRASDGYDPVSRQSNLIVETAKPLTEQKLREMLRQEAKRQGKEYGYYFLTVTGGFTTTGQGNTMNSFNVSPVEVFRVYVDGRPDELVRGVDLIGTPLSMFSHIAAAGNGPTIFTGSCGAESGWVPVSCVSPQIFVTQIETQRRKKAQQTPPLLAAPVSDAKSATLDSRASIKQEVQRAAESLNVRGAMTPLHVSAMTSNHRTAHVVGELGGISAIELQPWTMNLASEVLVGDTMRSNKADIERYFTTQVALQPDELSLRRAVWKTTDNSYKDALNVYAQKQNYLSRNPMKPEYAAIADVRMPESGEILSQKTITEDIDTAAMAAMARRLSAVFLEFPKLYNTSVTIDMAQMKLSRTTNRDFYLSDVQQWVKVNIEADMQCEDGTPWHDNLTFNCATLSQALAISDSAVRDFAQSMMLLRSADVMDEEYHGPVMYEDCAAVLGLTDNLLAKGALIANHSVRNTETDYGKKIGTAVADKRLTFINYSSLRDYNGTPLMGAYTVDADGVTPAESLVLIENGIMQRQLNGLTPTPYAKSSTGSFRFGTNPAMPFPEITIGTLHVKAAQTTAQQKMITTLLKAAKKEGKKYAYIVSLQPGRQLLMLYRVDVKTGERHLMRTNTIDHPTDQQLNNLLAVSSSEIVVNNIDNVCTSIIAPASFIVANEKIQKATLQPISKPVVKYPLENR